jgi:hypothetical protein
MFFPQTKSMSLISIYLSSSLSQNVRAWYSRVTVEDLQSGLIFMSEYCDKWGLEVNTAKTKVMVYRK